MLQTAPDSLRAALDSVFRSGVYAWRPRDETGSAIVRWWQRLLAWLAALREDNPLVFRVLVAVLVLVLVAIIAHAAWILVRTVRGAARPVTDEVAPGEGARRDAAWHLAEADRAAGEGRYREALQLAFLGLALTLDARGALRFHPAKTPAEYAAEARLGDADRARLRDLVRTLYACAFGGAACGRDEYARWRALATREWHAPAH
ncbi:MAG TPA: DUF4129 domain-containing protein [Gemmatimonadales bacterium]|nr:DUF4129 domain-containing protein [Gemmatimonadales bacterium]